MKKVIMNINIRRFSIYRTDSKFIFPGISLGVYVCKVMPLSNYS